MDEIEEICAEINGLSQSEKRELFQALVDGLDRSSRAALEDALGTII